LDGKKKSDWIRINKAYMRRSAHEKKTIIDLVERSEIGVKRTLQELGIPRSNFYRWYAAYKEYGYDGLLPQKSTRNQYWNRIPEKERQDILEYSLDYEDLSPRELAFKYTDEKKRYISESSVYRILKSHGLITSPAWIVMQASDEYKHKTSRPNQMWQTDFTYLKVQGWGWYYLATILDDYSRYVVHWELCKTMQKDDVERVVQHALQKEGINKQNAPKLLSDNGPCYIANGLDEYLSNLGVDHIRGKPLHPQTQGKIERWHRSMKNVIKLQHYYLPSALQHEIDGFVDYYNNDRYHESLSNLTPESVYRNYGSQILKERKRIKISTLNHRRRLNKKVS